MKLTSLESLQQRKFFDLLFIQFSNQEIFIFLRLFEQDWIYIPFNHNTLPQKLYNL
jgi:hypothetical protein